MMKCCLCNITDRQKPVTLLELVSGSAADEGEHEDGDRHHGEAQHACTQPLQLSTRCSYIVK